MVNMTRSAASRPVPARVMVWPVLAAATWPSRAMPRAAVAWMAISEESGAATLVALNW